MTVPQDLPGPGHGGLAALGERRGITRPRSEPHEAAELSEFTDAQIRQIAAIALVATAVDDADRQRRDDTAREHRRRFRALGRQ